MKYGISIYPGLEGSLEENLILMDIASKKGVNQLFISFNIPEIDVEAFKKEINILLKTAKEYHFNIISDVSPTALQLVGLDNLNTNQAALLGLTTLRLDYGFTPAEIAVLSRNTDNVKIQLNASTVTPQILTELAKEKADFSQITALHNFYPREHTGLSEAFFCNKTKLLHNYGIEVYAFIAGSAHKRKPICAGLPTLEKHRNFSVSLAARHLSALGADGIFIGDSFPSKSELSELTAVQDNLIQLTVTPLTTDAISRELLQQTFTSRADEAEDVIRAEESRDYTKKHHYTIEKHNTVVRQLGAVTLDNKDYLRYMGELQIMKRTLPADKRSNVIAQIAESELFLLPYITPEQKFSFLLS